MRQERTITKRALALALLLGLAAPVLVPAVGQAADGAVLAEAVIPSEQIVASIRRAYPGKPIGAVQGPSPAADGSLRYGIRWLTPDGHVLFISVDARSGDIIDVRGGE